MRSECCAAHSHLDSSPQHFLTLCALAVWMGLQRLRSLAVPTCLQQASCLQSMGPLVLYRSSGSVTVVPCICVQGSTLPALPFPSTANLPLTLIFMCLKCHELMYHLRPSEPTQNTNYQQCSKTDVRCSTPHLLPLIRSWPEYSFLFQP